MQKVLWAKVIVKPVCNSLSPLPGAAENALDELKKENVAAFYEAEFAREGPAEGAGDA